MKNTILIGSFVGTLLTANAAHGQSNSHIIDKKITPETKEQQYREEVQRNIA